MTLLAALTGDLADRSDAVRVDGEACSWSDLRERSRAVAARIEGAPAVATCATASLDTVVAVCGALAAGVPLVPVPPDAGPVERAHILRDSGAVALLGAAPWDDELPRIPLDAGPTTSLPEPPIDAVGLIMYTSGTTGLPKGAILSRRALAADLDALADAWAWTPDDHLVHGLPLFHVHGLVLGVLGALRVGSRLTHTGRPTPAAYAQAARQPLLRGADGVVAVSADAIRGVCAECCPAARVGQRAVAGLGVRAPRRAHRSSPGRALRHDRDADHAQHASRRRASSRIGRVSR